MSVQTYNPDQPIVAQYSAATVIGLGATGFSVVRYLCARGIDVRVVDTRDQPPWADQLKKDYPQVELTTGDLGSLDGCELLVVSPGVALAEPALRQARQAGAHLIGDIELFIQENTKPVIAITGSNGKSTVTTLVGKMCESGKLMPLVAGNIGLPVLDALTDAQHYDIAVLELSSFQLETTSIVPAESAAILNVSPDHMDRYDSMGDYLLAKARILRGAKRAVLPRHDEQLGQLTNVGEKLSFELDAPSNDDEFGMQRKSGVRWLSKGKQRLIKLREIPLVGLHNVKNVLASLALVDFLQLDNADLVAAIKSFKGLPHRMQTVSMVAGITWVDDSKATNIGATSTALQNLEENVVWIAGGQGKGAQFEELRVAVQDNIKLLILLGEDAPLIEAALQGLLPITNVKSMREAVQVAANRAEKGSVVLLSPACASFDMYKSFEHRGQDFANCVQAQIDRGAA